MPVALLDHRIPGSGQSP